MSQTSTEAIERVAFIGLGVMGAPMAAHLAAAGFDVIVYNRTTARAHDWVARHGGHAAATPEQAADGADAVCVCVGRDADLRAVAYGDEGILAALARGAVVVDHTTVSAELARELGEAAGARGAAFVDAPVSGGQAGAQQGRLSVMAGGESAALQRVQPVLDCYAARLVHVGGIGAGQLTKMVNQICIAGLIQALAEGVDFARRAELDLERVLEAVGGGAAQSWQMDNRARTMAEGAFDFGFAVDWMRKDLAICLDEARRNGSQLPVTALVDQFYAQLQQRGGGDADTSSLIRLLNDP
jgi:3-hydroxyisobutyrate dehydrogenase-like beta-hydroxyacid dehydrogenase